MATNDFSNKYIQRYLIRSTAVIMGTHGLGGVCPSCISWSSWLALFSSFTKTKNNRITKLKKLYRYLISQDIYVFTYCMCSTYSCKSLTMASFFMLTKTNWKYIITLYLFARICSMWMNITAKILISFWCYWHVSDIKNIILTKKGLPFCMWANN